MADSTDIRISKGPQGLRVEFGYTVLTDKTIQIGSAICPLANISSVRAERDSPDNWKFLIGLAVGILAWPAALIMVPIVLIGDIRGDYRNGVGWFLPTLLATICAVVAWAAWRLVRSKPPASTLYLRIVTNANEHFRIAFGNAGALAKFQAELVKALNSVRGSMNLAQINIEHFHQR